MVTMHKHSRRVEPTTTGVDQIQLVVRARLELGVTRFRVWGPISRKSRENFSGQKPVVKLPSACFEKLISEHVFYVSKTKGISKFEGLEPRRGEDVKEIVTTEMNRPEKFRHL